MFRLLLYWELEMRTCVFVVFTSGRPEDGQSWNLGLHGISIVHSSTVDFSVFFEGMGWGIAVLFSVP